MISASPPYSIRRTAASPNSPYRGAFSDAQCLTSEMIRTLWQTISDIERQFGKPVDIEWVIEPAWRRGAPISIVQARPITTLDAEAEQAPAKWDALQYAAKYGLGIKAAPGATRS